MAPPDFLSSAVLEALEHAGIGVAVTVYDGETVKPSYVSERAADITGRRPDELLDRSIFEYVAPEALEALREQSERWESFQPAAQQIETIFVRPGGERVRAELGFARLEIDEGTATIAFIIDVTDSHRAKSIAREGDDRLAQMISALPEAMAIIRNGLVRSANSAMLEVPGVEVGEPFPEAGEELANALAAPSQSPVQLPVVINPPGMHLLATVFAVDFADGPATVVLARDETDRLQMQSQLVSTDRLASLGSLASGIAHSVNNPLTTVLLNLAALERDLPIQISDPQSKLLRQVREAHRAAERVRASIRRLRGFSSWREQPSDLDVRSILDAVIGLVEYAAGPSIQLVNDYDSVPLVTAGEAKLAQVFLALLRNALDAIPEDSGERAEVLIRTFVASGDRVVVEVSDPGIGISERDLPHVFDPFYTTDARRHSGLGLTTCREIVRELGGHIEVTSPDHPTTVRVELPASQTSQRVDRAPANVLLIEPHFETAARARRALKQSYDVRLVGSASRGLEVVLGGDRFDLMLCCSKISDPDPVSLWNEIAARRPGLEDKLVVVGETPLEDAPSALRQLPSPIDEAAIARVLGERGAATE